MLKTNESLDILLTQEQKTAFLANEQAHAKRIFRAGCDGYALIQKTNGTVLLRVYGHDAYDADWANVHNQVYGELLSSDSCERVLFHGQTLAIPASLANLIYAQMSENILHDTLVDRVHAMDANQPELFTAFRTTCDDIVGNEELMTQMTNRFRNLDNPDEPVSKNLDRAILDTLEDWTARHDTTGL